MATIRRRKLKGGVRYDVRYRDGEGNHHSLTFTSEAEARDQAARVHLAVKERRHIDPKAGRLTLRAYLLGAADNPGWLANRLHLRETSRAHYLALVKRAGPLLDRRLDQVTSEVIQNWVRSLVVANLAPQTIESYYTKLATILSAAARERKIPESPCQNIVRPKVERKRIEPMTPAQVSQMANALTATRTFPSLRSMILVGAKTGMRYGELLGLTANCIDARELTIRIEQQWTRSRRLGPPKTERSKRTLPIDEATLTILTEHMRESAPLAPLGLVFHMGNRPHSTNSVREQWKRAADRLGLPFTFHDLRHYYASALIRAGIDVKTVQARMGHATALETLDTYGHLWPDSDDRTRKALAEMVLT